MGFPSSGGAILATLFATVVSARDLRLDGGAVGWERNKWRVSTDRVMGGRSTGQVIFEDNGATMNFFGNLNVVGGGFAYVGRDIPRVNLSSYAGIVVEVETIAFSGDAPFGLDLHLRDTSGCDFSAAFAVPVADTSGQVTSAFIPINSFDNKGFGNFYCNNLDMTSINGMKFYVLYQEGKYEARIRSITAVERVASFPPTVLTVTSKEEVVSLLTATVESGTFLWNKSNPNLCIAVYWSALESLAAAMKYNPNSCSNLVQLSKMSSKSDIGYGLRDVIDNTQDTLANRVLSKDELVKAVGEAMGCVIVDTPKQTICVDKPGYFSVADVNDSRSTCKQIHMLTDRSRRKTICESNVATTKESLASRCPIACAHWKCYAFYGSCRDSNESFITANNERTCAWIKNMDSLSLSRTQMCASTAEPSKARPKVPVQDMCPVACQSSECSCEDKNIPFMSKAAYSDDGKEIEPAKERTCSSLYGITNWEYRNVVCLLDIYTITPYFGDKALQVYYMCPKACGFRKECFCRDTKKAITTPNSRNVSYCKDVKSYNGNWCDETKEPVFARSCPVICGNPYCNMMNRSDSRDTLSFSVKNEQISTTCWLIWKAKDSNEGRDEYACDAYETDLNLKGSVLCPNACAGNIPFK